MSRRASDVQRELAVWLKDGASILLEMAGLVEAAPAIRVEPQAARKQARRPVRIVRPGGESDELARRRADQMLRRSGLVPR